MSALDDAEEAIYEDGDKARYSGDKMNRLVKIPCKSILTE